MPTPGERRTGRGTGTRSARARLAALGPEALALLDHLGAVRFLSPGQAQALAPGRAGRDLRALAAVGLVEAVPYRRTPTAPLERIATLTPAGARAAAARAWHAAGGPVDEAVRHARGAARADATSLLFLSHALALADLYVAVRERTGAGFSWRSGPGARVAYRSLLAPDGRGLVVPDAVVAPADLPAEASALALGGVAIEVDRGTMGMRSIDAKLLRYRELVADRGRFGPVLFVAADPHRRERLRERLDRAGLVGDALDLEGAARRLVEAIAASPGADGG